MQPLVLGAVAVSLCWPGIPWPGTRQTYLLHSTLLGTSCCQCCSQGTALRGQAVLPGSDLCSRAVLALPGIALLCLLHTAACSSLPELPAILQQAQIQEHVGMFFLCFLMGLVRGLPSCLFTWPLPAQRRGFLCDLGMPQVLPFPQIFLFPMDSLAPWSVFWP